MGEPHTVFEKHEFGEVVVTVEYPRELPVTPPDVDVSFHPETEDAARAVVEVLGGVAAAASVYDSFIRWSSPFTARAKREHAEFEASVQLPRPEPAPTPLSKKLQAEHKAAKEQAEKGGEG